MSAINLRSSTLESQPFIEKAPQEVENPTRKKVTNAALATFCVLMLMSAAVFPAVTIVCVTRSNDNPCSPTVVKAGGGCLAASLGVSALTWLGASLFERFRKNQ